ncbi:DUF1326 domain-containing protein [Aurantimonas sp. A2-1-M11]|uniref:DUF1326 domain-containing protein n=1 Tax=Aurantimonas sp. A2-1-M11 TaxID=3113712 RepID=UPI002F920B8C
MSYIDWALKGPKIAACSCDYGCPCEFNGKPTEGLCEGLECMLIEDGWFGNLRLDGLKVAAVYRWPGPVHEGGGIVQGFIDSNATPKQAEALATILNGGEQEPTTVFNIYGATISKELAPVSAPIAFDSNIEARTGWFRIEGHLTLVLEPIRNPVTGLAHRARIVLPEGFEFREAEVASGTFTSDGEILMHRQSRYGALWNAAYGPHGIIDA